MSDIEQHSENSNDICPECNRPKTFNDWCKECYSKKFQQNFGNWTSGNKKIDKFIQGSQLSAINTFELLEWIPYNRLRNIKYLTQGGFSTVYKAIFLDGIIEYWDYEKQDWKRDCAELDEQDYDASDSQIKNPLKINEKYGSIVVIKSLNDSSNIVENFLKEWKSYLQCQREASLNNSYFNPVIGITQDPDTLNYMVVMDYADEGSLKDNLLIKKYNPNESFLNLLQMSRQLEAIHKSDLVHGDLHDGNILFNGDPLISDFGLCKPVNQPNVKEETYGVMPYMAPEVLRGKPYTTAADIYSFGIIMWEMTSGVQAFHNIPHDLDLSLDICEGTRPEIIEGTMPEYVELMKRCWDNDPKKRPTANELNDFFTELSRNYPFHYSKRIPIPENEPEIKYHPKSCYISRKFDESAKLNNIYELSGRVVIDSNHDEVDETDEFAIRE
ncbi:hypothetical protein RclHR1_02430003 [Rhizophagus clarus]|uniref:Kinase-like domain-containing protein n=1 Tax=Rhizophagus clarus TaxID=94130 RepID=A0A2Z6R229_9GLOM|nr:hypothetical protein RclHR1_02430003 [Rhizophagus clarus]GET02522.1 kinase-like domain-containing protein [Rhizophagus clarus]